MDSEGRKSLPNSDIDDNSQEMIIPTTDYDFADTTEKEFDDLMDGNLDRRLSRVQSVVVTEEVRQVREQLRRAGIDTTDVQLKPPKKICCIGVKEGVNWWNVLMIPYIVILVLTIASFVNA